MNEHELAPGAADRELPNPMPPTRPTPAADAPVCALPEWLAPHADEVQNWGPIDGPDRTCWVGGCRRSPHLHGLCRGHYFRAYFAWKNPRRSSARERGDG